MLFINIMQLYMDIDQKCLGNVHMQLSLKITYKGKYTSNKLNIHQCIL